MKNNLIRNKDLVKDVCSYFRIDTENEEVINISLEENFLHVETERAEMGFQDDGCLQCECTKTSCLGCLARQIKIEHYMLQLKEVK